MADMPLRVVDGLELDEPYREVLRPGGLMADRHGRLRRLPRFFYEIESWDAALETELSPHFEVWEFLNVDVRETDLLREWPRYIPCAVSLLATHLELLREEVDTYIHVGANGGYRSPSHRLARHASTHCWGTAVNVYRIGDDWMDDPRTMQRYGRLARRLMPALWVRRYGDGPGETIDHLHLDLGYTTFVPGDVTGEPGMSEGEGTDEGEGTGPAGEDGTDEKETAEAEAR
jgi:hypothetical protein